MNRTPAAEPLFDRACHALDLLAPTGSLAVAVSGGSDSTALLALAMEWADRRARCVIAVTVDHGLRPESAAEAATVADLCQRLGVRHETLSWRPEPASEDGNRRPVGQARARRARHALLADWARRNGTDRIALGHTQDDRIETFLLRVRAGSSWYGLASPLPAAPSPAAEGTGVRLVRPLLCLERDELRSMLRRRGLGWIDDPTNRSRRSERVRTRQFIAALPGHTGSSVIRILNQLSELRASVLAGARDMMGRMQWGGTGVCIPSGDWAESSQNVQVRLTEALVAAFGGADVLCGGTRAKAALDAAMGKTGGSATLGGALLKWNRSGLTVSRAPLRRGATHAGLPGFDCSAAQRRAFALLDDPVTGALYV